MGDKFNNSNKDIEINLNSLKEHDTSDSNEKSNIQSYVFFKWIIGFFLVGVVFWYYNHGPMKVDLESVLAKAKQNSANAINNYDNLNQSNQQVNQLERKSKVGSQAFADTCGGCHNHFDVGFGSINLSERIAGLTTEDIIIMVNNSPNMISVRNRKNLQLIADYLISEYKTNSLAKNNSNSRETIPVSKMNSKFLFIKHCGGCHKANGYGDGIFDLSQRGKELGVDGVIEKINNPPNPKMHLSSALTTNQKKAIAYFLAGLNIVNGKSTNINEGGKGLYETNFCSQCHVVNGEGVNGNGPDLTHIGSKRTKKWLVQFLTNPKEIYPNTKMPVVPLTKDEIDTISQYLAELK